MRKCFILSLVVVLFSFLFHFNTVKAEKSEESNNDLTKETYEKLINEDVLDKKISYDTWLEINDDSLFDQLEGGFSGWSFLDRSNLNITEKNIYIKKRRYIN